MASTDIEVGVGINNIENDTLSVDKCIFCSASLDGESNILNCLHIVCKKCVEEKKGISGVKCKCSIITEGKLIDYPIISKNILKRIICNTSTCNKEATRICIYCKSYYCIPCSKIHLDSNRDHKSSFIYTYPMRKPFELCLNCNNKCVEVFCTICSVEICSFCHLIGHIGHKFKAITTMAQDVKKNFSHDKLELEKSLKYLDYCSEKADKQLVDLENKKIILKKEIEEQIKLLHKAINDRENELKNSVDLCILDTVSKINEEKKIIVNLKKRNSYYVELTQSILNYDDEYSLLKVSKLVGNQLNGSKVDTSNIRSVSNVNVDLKFDYTESINSCFSAIKKLGSIVSLPMNSLHEFVNLKLESEDDCLDSEIHASFSDSSNMSDNDIESSDSDFDFENKEYDPQIKCSVCNQWSNKSMISVDLIKCINCKRLYHKRCHIPVLPIESINNDNFSLKWKCTLCKDITECFEILNEKIASSDFTNSEMGRKVIERILMEIYCQNNDSDGFRDCLDKELYPDYYKKITNPISLNIIRQRVDSYKSPIDFIKDLKQVFTNAMLYYTATSPDYVSAVNLQNYLKRFFNKNLPNLDHKYF